MAVGALALSAASACQFTELSVCMCTISMAHLRRLAVAHVICGCESVHAALLHAALLLHVGPICASTRCVLLATHGQTNFQNGFYVRAIRFTSKYCTSLHMHMQLVCNLTLDLPPEADCSVVFSLSDDIAVYDFLCMGHCHLHCNGFLWCMLQVMRCACIGDCFALHAFIDEIVGSLSASKL